MNCKVERIIPKVYSVIYDFQYDLCMAFVRIQEFYESPKFHGKYFTLEEFMDWWSVNYGYGSFDYPSRWAGFNIPGSVLVNWIDKFSTSTRDKEKELIVNIENCINNDNVKMKDCYIIGSYSDGNKGNIKDVINHELAHAMYCVYPEYKEHCDKLLDAMAMKRKSSDIKKLLIAGYAHHVIEDELQAYYSNGGGPSLKIKGIRKFANNYKIFKEKFT